MRRAMTLSAMALAIAALIVSPAAAGKTGSGRTGGGKGGHTTPPPASTGSFSLVLLDSTDGVGHYGQHYSFSVQTNAAYPFVRDDCSQNGTRVYSEYKGFYPGWVWGQEFTWWSSAWSGGAADCVATLYYTDSTFNNPTTMATLSFHVAA